MADSSNRILFVLTNTTELGDTGRPTGVFLAEAAHPYQVVTEAGFAVDFASPAGRAGAVRPHQHGEDGRGRPAFPR
ncbi:MAG: hypothetical protein U5L11_04495 [Arhodomonas sp.]|nr:hypothetical protein [Arhodomonas sp.]